MMKDITLGQYYPGDSIIHKADPRAKIIVAILYIKLYLLRKAWFHMRRFFYLL